MQTRVYLSRSHGLKRHTALNKTSGLASPRANYPHLFLDHVRKRAARTSSSRHRRAAVAAAAWSRWSARAGLSRCSAGHDFSSLTHDGSIDNYRRHFYTYDVPPSTLTSRIVNLHDPSQDADPRVFVREISDMYSVVNDDSSETVPLNFFRLFYIINVYFKETYNY